jgi:hypothetical protein
VPLSTGSTLSNKHSCRFKATSHLQYFCPSILPLAEYIHYILAIMTLQYTVASSLALASLLGIAYFAVRLLLVGRRPTGLPPGPMTLPLIGNLYLMPTSKPYKVFAQWGKKYGPIYSLMVGSNPLILIQSHKIAKDLLDKRGANYSSRPDLYILSELSSRGLRQVAMVCSSKLSSFLQNSDHIRSITTHGVRSTASTTRS